MPFSLPGTPISAELLRRMMDQAPTAMIVVAVPELRVAYANRAGQRAATGDAAALVGRPVGEAFGFVDPAMIARAAQSGVAQRAPPMRTPPAPATGADAAAPIWWEVACVALDGTEPPMVMVTAVDVTAHEASELQRAQTALRLSEERLRAVLHQMPAALFIVEAPDGRVAFKSRLVDDVLGYPNNDLTAARAGLQGWAIHADGSPFALDDYPSRRALFEGETVQGEPMTYSRGDGRLIDLEVYAGPVRDESGAIVAAVVATLDVTELRQAARSLRESEERLRVALDAGGLGTWEVDPATSTNRIGQSLAVMLGLPAEPIDLDRSVSAGFIHPDDRDRVASDFARALAGDGDYVNEFRALRVDGATRWFIAHGRIIRAQDGSPLRAVGVIRDVTDRRAREDRLREAVEAREVLLREADHRIKNSLQLVGSLLGMQRLRLSDPDAVAALDGAMSRVMAISEAHRALHESADLRHVALDAMLRDLCVHAGRLNPALRFLCDCPAGLELDTERAIPLGLVVSELLTNAAKHAYPSGCGEVRTTVAAVGGRFEIAVSDAGVGMAQPAASRGGLGSTIMRALVGQIGAEMVTESSPGAGTRNWLRFAERVSDPSTRPPSRGRGETSDA